MLKAHCPNCQQPMTVIYTDNYGLHPRKPEELTSYDCRNMGCQYKSNPSGYLKANPDAVPHIRD